MHYYYITGTSSGLGKALAEKILQQENSIVIGISRTQTIQHPHYIHFSMNLSDLNQTQGFEFGLHDTAKKIVLINNAGATGEIRHAGELQNENIISTYHLNIVSPHLLINTFIHSFKLHAAEKIIVNVTSGAASSTYDGWTVYCATKAALDMMSLTLAKEFELDKNGFKIFSIAPNVMETNMQKQIRETDENAFSRKNKFVDLYDNNSLYDPKDVAEKYLHIIENAQKITETIHRIIL